MRILITRPNQEISRESLALEALGHEVVKTPLLTIEELLDVSITIEGFQAILVSSRAGIRALAKLDAKREMPVFTVGEGTAEVAIELGYSTVESADGDWLALSALVKRRLDCNNGPLLHASGLAVAGDIEGSLSADGFEVKKAVLYEAKSADSFTSVAEENLRAGKLDAVLFFSARTAETFVNIATESSLLENCKLLEAFCLSPNIAEVANKIDWLRVRVPLKPTRDALYQLLDIN